MRRPQLSNLFDSNETALKPGRLALVVVYLVFAAVVFRTFAIKTNHPLISWYIGFELAYLILYSAILLVPNTPNGLKHFFLLLQSVLVLYALSWRPEFDFLVVLFLLMTYPVSVFFTGKIRWIWIFSLILLTGGSLIFYLGVIRGLALSLTTMAGEIVLPAFIIVNHKIEKARIKSQVLLKELQETHQQLEWYANRVEDLAAIQERNRLARELHDTVSQLIFSINLTARSAQLLLTKDPARVPEQLNRLQEMTTDALGQLRSLITQLRPSQNPEKI
jgi:signal transduction histidine kinase